MRATLTGLLPFLWLLFLSGCAMLSSPGTQAPYHSAAFDDKNEVPEWMAPPKDLSDPSKLDPMHMQARADYHFALGETYSLGGASEKAIEEFRLTLIYDPNSAVVRTRLAAEYMRMGMANEAIEQAELAAKMDEKGVAQKLILGKLYTGLKLYDRALEQYRMALALDKTNFDAALFIGAILAEKGLDREAVKHFTDLGNNPDFERRHLAYYYIGKIQQQTLKAKDLESAEKAFQKSLAAKPDFEDSALSLSRIYIHQQKKEKAIRLLNGFQASHGPSEKVADLLVNLFMDDERFDEAFQQFEILEAQNPDDLGVKMKMALILMDKKQYEKAITYLNAILSREPQFDKVRFYLAAVYEELKRYSEAILHFGKVPPSSPHYPDSVIHSSYLYKLQGSSDRALAAIRDGIKNRGDVAEFYTLYASLLDEAKEHKKAVTMLKDAVERFPDNTQLLFFLGSMYDKTGDLKKTIETMTRVLELDENHVQALNYLAYTYAEKEMELDSAEALVRRALSHAPNDGYIMDTLGWVLFKKGDIKNAVHVLEKAYALKNTESIIAEHLGDAYYKYQLPDKAKDMYMKAVKAESDLNNLEKLHNKIKAIDSQRDRQPASAP